MTKVYILAIIAATILISACQTPDLIRPIGFANYDGHEYGYRSVSPESIMYRLRSYDNEEKGDLAFWKIALKTHMLDSGYILLKESAIKTKSATGYLLKLAAPVGNTDYSYLVALFVDHGKIVVIESAGEAVNFEAHSRNIIKTINNTDLSKIN